MLTFVCRSPKFGEPGNRKEAADVLLPLQNTLVAIQVRARQVGEAASITDVTELARLDTRIERVVEQVKTIQRAVESGQLNSAENLRGISVPLVWDEDVAYLGIVIADVVDQKNVSQSDALTIQNGLSSVREIPVHVFFLSDFKHILNEITTIPDLISYCEARQKLILTGVLDLQRELEFLAFFKTQYDVLLEALGGECSYLVLADGMWEEDQRSFVEERRARADRWHESRIVDGIIEHVHELIGFQSNGGDLGTVESYKVIASELALLNRTERIDLGRRMIEKLERADQDPKGFSYIGVHAKRIDTAFLILCSREKRPARADRLKTLTYATQATLGAHCTLGIATENLRAAKRSFDFVLMRDTQFEDPEKERRLAAPLFTAIQHVKTDDEWGNPAG